MIPFWPAGIHRRLMLFAHSTNDTSATETRVSVAQVAEDALYSEGRLLPASGGWALSRRTRSASSGTNELTAVVESVLPIGATSDELVQAFAADHAISHAAAALTVGVNASSIVWTYSVSASFPNACATLWRADATRATSLGEVSTAVAAMEGEVDACGNETASTADVQVTLSLLSVPSNASLQTSVRMDVGVVQTLLPEVVSRLLSCSVDDVEVEEASMLNGGWQWVITTAWWVPTPQPLILNVYSRGALVRSIPATVLQNGTRASVQLVRLISSSVIVGGSFTLRMGDVSTRPIAAFARADELASALAALPLAGAGGVTVSDAPLPRTSSGGRAWLVTFTSAPAGLPLLVGNASEFTLTSNATIGARIEVTAVSSASAAPLQGRYELHLGNSATPPLAVDAPAGVVAQALLGLPLVQHAEVSVEHNTTMLLSLKIRLWQVSVWQQMGGGEAFGAPTLQVLANFSANSAAEARLLTLKRADFVAGYFRLRVITEREGTANQEGNTLSIPTPYLPISCEAMCLQLALASVPTVGEAALIHVHREPAHALNSSDAGWPSVGGYVWRITFAEHVADDITLLVDAAAVTGEHVVATITDEQAATMRMAGSFRLRMAGSTVRTSVPIAHDASAHAMQAAVQRLAPHMLVSVSRLSLRERAAQGYAYYITFQPSAQFHHERLSMPRLEAHGMRMYGDAVRVLTSITQAPCCALHIALNGADDSARVASLVWLTQPAIVRTEPRIVSALGGTALRVWVSAGVPAADVAFCVFNDTQRVSAHRIPLADSLVAEEDSGFMCTTPPLLAPRNVTVRVQFSTARSYDAVADAAASFVTSTAALSVRALPLLGTVMPLLVNGAQGTTLTVAGAAFEADAPLDRRA
ncbi:hypothetical protein EON66_03845 [archaeon]|nr:MAG: hypothetical protein EON66_03845 [archaeon]